MLRSMTTLTDIKTAEIQGEAGIAAAVTSAGSEWVAYALSFVEKYLKENATLFCDDVWQAGLDQPHDKRAFGYVMKKAITEGWMVKVGSRPSVQSNLSLRHVYASMLYKGPWA